MIVTLSPLLHLHLYLSHHMNFAKYHSLRYLNQSNLAISHSQQTHQFASINPDQKRNSHTHPHCHRFLSYQRLYWLHRQLVAAQSTHCLLPRWPSRRTTSFRPQRHIWSKCSWDFGNPSPMAIGRSSLECSHCDEHYRWSRLLKIADPVGNRLDW